MTTTTVFAIEEDGLTSASFPFLNSHRYAMMIWPALCERYTPTMSVFDGDWFKRCHAAIVDSGSEVDRLVFEMTFDRFAVRGDHLRAVAAAFRKFDASYWPARSLQHGISHLPAMADTFDQIAESRAEGACIWTTSTTENLWEGYNFRSGSEHKWVGEDFPEF